MEYLTKENSLKFKNGNITAREYPINDPDINCAVVEIKGRHPASDFLINEKCKELVYITNGVVSLNTEDQSVVLNEGDMAMIKKGERYFWDGYATMITSCTPPWTPEQNKNVK